MLFEGGGGHFRLDLANLLLDALSHIRMEVRRCGQNLAEQPQGFFLKPLVSIRIGFPSD
jgi:hypothetical protein